MSTIKSLLVAAAVWTAASVTAAQAEILIGVAGPMTGPYAWSGEQFRTGAELAVQKINAAGGVLGERVRLISSDDAADPEQAVAVANKFVSDGVVFVAGHWASGASIAASKVYEQAGILMISPSSTNPKLTDEGGPNVFRVCGRDDRQGVVAGDYLADSWADKKIAILHDGTAYGEGLAEETRKQLHKRGVSEAIYDAFVPGKADYSPLVSRMQAAGIDVLYVGGYSAEAGLMVREARDQDYDVQLVSGDGLSVADFWLITGPAGEGTLFTFFPDPRDIPTNADLVAEFRALLGVEPEGYTLYAYAAVQTWAQAIERTGSLKLDAAIAALRSNEFDTVLGKIAFDAKGDIKDSGFIWYIWKSGRYVQVEQS
ncbi:MAG: branched-chain amino acid ABC transporter substrate-binding protein [Hyphomicrobiaceae bacterium]